MLKIGLAGALSLTGMEGTVAAQGDYVEVDPYRSATASLTRGLRVRQDGSNHNILLALRRLKDPAMRPLFQYMFSSDEPTLRIDAVLALAELGNTAVDPFLLQQMGEKERSLALMAAISLDLYDPDFVRSMKEFRELTEVEKTMMIIMEIRLGMELDAELLQELVDSEDPATRMVAAVLMSDAMGLSEPLQVELERFMELGLQERILISSALIDVASWHPMPSGLAVFRQIANDPEMSRSLRLAAIDSALGCDCPEGIRIWTEATKLAEASGDRSRLGVAAIERGIRSEDWTGIADERQLNQRIAKAGRSLLHEEEAVANVTELLKIRHPLSVQAALALADHLEDPGTAEAIRLMIMRAAISDVRLQPVVGRIYRDLSENPPEELGRMIWQISELENMELVTEVLLTAILETKSPRSVEYADLFSDHGDRTIRSLALLVKARSGEELDAQELQELTLITTGGGRVDPSIRSIAGWLWLEHNDQTDKAMMEIMSDT